MITRNMDYYNLDMIINPIKSRIKQIFLIRVATSAERYCNEEQKWWSQSASPLHALTFNNIIAS